MKKLRFDLINSDFPRVSQTFISLEGEGINVGEPSLYIRFAGCYSAACRFCDTKFSWYNKTKYPFFIKGIQNFKNTFYQPGEWYSQIKEEQKKHPNRTIERVTITGGEPLHFIKSIKHIADIKFNLNFDRIELKLFGIESNGNLLSSVENLLEVIKTYKYLERAGIQPILTISPKIESESCYENQLTQVEVNNMYKKVYYNLENYFPYSTFYKFVWGVNKKMDNLILQQLKELDKLGVQKNHIFLMPYTPFDPLGKNKEEWEKSKDITAKKALELGIRYSPRIHVDRKLD